MQDLQTALKSRIQELELAEAEEKEISKACKKVMREAQKFISNKEHTVAQKLEFLQQKFMDRVEFPQLEGNSLFHRSTNT